MFLRRAAIAALLATTALMSSTAGAVAPRPSKSAIDAAAAVAAPLPGAADVQRDLHPFTADGDDYVLVLDTAVVNGVGVARMSVITVDLRRVVMQADGTSLGAPTRRRDPEPPPPPYFVGQGVNQQLCYPGYNAEVEDEDCWQKKMAAMAAAELICATGAGVAGWTAWLFPPFGAVSAAAALAACGAANLAVSMYECKTHFVTVDPYCTWVYPRPVSPQAQAAHDEYRRRTGQEPPQPCGPPPGDLSRSATVPSRRHLDGAPSESVVPRRPPLCE